MAKGDEQGVETTRAKGEGDKERKKRAPSKPRPLFVLYRPVMDSEGNPDAEIVAATRNAADVLERVDSDRELKLKRIMAS